MYWKIVSGGQIVDACDGMHFVRWQEKNRMMISCAEADADGFLSSDGGSVYLLPDKEIGSYPNGTYSEIMEEEYDALREEIDAGAEIPDAGGETRDTPARTRLNALEEEVARLTSMTAKDNIPQGNYFVMHDEVYQATDPIAKGTEIRPGYNCHKKTLDEFLNREGE